MRFSSMVLTLLLCAGPHSLQAASSITPDPVATRLTITTPDPNQYNSASLPAMAMDPESGIQLVTWTWHQDGRRNSELYGQLLERSGAPISDQFQISTMGGPQYYHAASHPQVIFDSNRSRFFVTWFGYGENTDAFNGDSEVFARFVKLDGSMNEPQFQVSVMGPAFDDGYLADFPRAAFDPEQDRYLVVWRGTNTDIVSPKREIYGRYINGNGVIGNQFRISQTGPEDDVWRFVEDYDVVWNSTTTDFLIVWTSTGDGVDHVHNGMEVYGTHIPSGSVTTSGYQRLTSMTDPLGGITGGVGWTSVAWHADAEEYLLIWSGARGGYPTAVYGQFLQSNLSAVGGAEFNISNMESFFRLAVAPVEESFVVTWTGIAPWAPFVNEYEVFSGLVRPGAGPIGTTERISYNGPDGDNTWFSGEAAHVFDPQLRRMHYFWHADTPLSGNGLFEIYRTSGAVN